MPDLGRYVFEVSASYGISLALLSGLIGAYVIRARGIKRKLAIAETHKDA